MRDRWLTIAIVAGGRGRRMGRDKTTIVIDGATMLERVAHAAVATGFPVIVVGRERPEQWTMDDVDFIPDVRSDCGPLAGLVAALSHARTPVLALAADIPFITTDAISWLITSARASGHADGITVMNGMKMEPLFSVYGLPMLRHAEEMLADTGRRALHDLIALGDAVRIDAPESIRAALRNINTPEDLMDAGVSVWT